MYSIGINEGINGSVVVTKDEQTIFALQEERINRLKEFHGFPVKALSFALQYLNLDPSQVEFVCLSNLSSSVRDRATFQRQYAQRARSFSQRLLSGDFTLYRDYVWPFLPPLLVEYARKVGSHRANRIVENTVREHGFAASRIKRCHHHLAHASAAYFACRKDPITPHLVLTLDGGGDSDCAHVYLASKGTLKLLDSTPAGNSIGNIYSCVTQALGMIPHEHEYKLMGLAGYVDPRHATTLRAHFERYLEIDRARPARFKRKTWRLTSHLQPVLFKQVYSQRFDNICGGLQAFTEALLHDWVTGLIAHTGVRNVVAAGGVFMNVKANKIIAELPEIEHFDVFPSCGDESLAFGSNWYQLSTAKPDLQDRIKLPSLYLGPDASFDIATALELARAANFHIEPLHDTNEVVAALLDQGQIVARCCGRMEFGARALGNRSILADPSNTGVISRINRMIKCRDFWMPFAPAVLYECVNDYIRIPKSLPQKMLSPYMMHAFDTTRQKNDLCAALHPYDNTARAQIVVKEQNPKFHDLIERFRRKRGIGALLNTSFNIHGSPIVMGAVDAMDVFIRSDLNYLLIDDVLISKSTTH